MKTIQRHTWLRTAAVLLLSMAVLTGCGNREDPADTTPDTVPSSETVLDTAADTLPATETETVSETVSETIPNTETEPLSETVPETPAVTVADTVPEAPPETLPETMPIVIPDPDKVADVSVLDTGYDIYKRVRGNEYGYRYGCTYLYNDDGSVDAYFACIGIVNEQLGMNEWDWISYRHSPDGGKTWEPERVVLTPTHGSQDSYSLCDPGVAYFGGYYYLAYTSTMNSLGMCNNIYIARSKNPDGPFEKWNGSGWGGYDPQPIFYYDESYETFGIGEPSLVELNGTLYIYYTSMSPAGDYTMVATADATDENWPLTLVNHGVATTGRSITDSLDVKYVEEWGKFIAVAAGDRMQASSWLGLYESTDGLHFELVDCARENTYGFMHNVGISSRPNGHIKLAEDAALLCVIYAYGEGWGTWNTRSQPISLALAEENDMVSERMKACLADEGLRDTLLPVAQRHVTMLRTDEDVYTVTADTAQFRIRLYQFDTYFNRSELRRGSTDGVEFLVYDESVVTIDGANLLATVKGVGTTAVAVRYGGATQIFHVTVTEEALGTGNASTLISVEPIHDYTVYIGEQLWRHPQIRVALRYGDGSYKEALVEDVGLSVTYTGYDKSIISVDAQGNVTALAIGETEVTVTVKGKSCTVKVTVTDNESDRFYNLPELEELRHDNIDFSKTGAESMISSSVSTDMRYDEDTEALKLTVTQTDPQIYITFPGGYDAGSYTKLEITYMAPKTNSPNARTRGMQIFYCVGNMQYVDEAHSTVPSLVSDGEFHTLTIDLTQLNGWEGQLTSLRLDYINIATAGDVLYIRSIHLS